MKINLNFLLFFLFLVDFEGNKAERECDFEDSKLCGWTQDTDDDFDWVWHTGATATARTGPTHDHTFKNVNRTGHYLYIETSYPRRPGDIARLLSPVYTSVEGVDEEFCFSVWYHLLGPDIEDQVGALKIYVIPAGSENEVSGLQPIFETSRNKGNVWLRGKAVIGAIHSFQIAIEGVRKNSYFSDIAIDDVRLYDCDEDLPTITAATTMVTTVKDTSTTQSPTATATTTKTSTTKMQNHLTSKVTMAMTSGNSENINTMEIETESQRESEIPKTVTDHSDLTTMETNNNIEEKCKEENKKNEDLLKKALEEEREKSKEAMQKAFENERIMSKCALQSVLELSKNETKTHIEQQTQLDHAARQRQLANLDVFIESARRYLKVLDDM